MEISQDGRVPDIVDDVVWGSSRSTSPLFMAVTALRMASVASVASASAQTVRERLKKDPGFRVYAVVFGVTATTNSAPQRFDWSRAGTFQNGRPGVRTR